MEPATDRKSFCIGIDLGTTNTCCAVEVQGKVVLLNAPDGSHLFPSYVQYQPEKTVVGSLARNSLVQRAKNDVICYTKRVMGKKFDDPFVQRHLLDCGVPISNYNNNVVFHVNERTITPTMVATDIVKHVLNTVEKKYNMKPTKVCVTIPARFGYNERMLTKRAVIEAGVPEDILVIKNEPTVAAYCYSYQQVVHNSKIMVYDFGGGTFDLSVLEVKNEEEYEVMCHEGNPELGGADVDEIILSWAEDQFYQQYGFPLLDEDLPEKTKRRIRTKNRAKVEECKIALATMDDVICELDIPPVVKGRIDDDIDTFTITITKHVLSEILHDLISQTTDTIRRVMDKNNLSVDDIDRVVLVGGSSRLCIVRDYLKAIFGEEKLREGVNPDECVAVGACLYLMGKATIKEVTSKSLGLKIRGNRVSCIIPVQTPIPTIKESVYGTSGDNKVTAKANVVQAYQETAGDSMLIDESCKFLHPIRWGGFPPRPKGEVEFRIQYRLTEEGLLYVKVWNNKENTLLLEEQPIQVDEI